MMADRQIHVGALRHSLSVQTIAVLTFFCANYYIGHMVSE